MPTRPMLHAPDAESLTGLARAALADLPEEFRRQLGDVAIAIEEFADDETLDEMGIESEFDLLGLYRGVPIGQKSVLSVPHDLDRIFLYRQPILAYWCETGEDLQDVVRHVLIHEIGHHFGYSDAEMEAIDVADD